VREGRYRLFTGTEDGEAAVFRIHIDTDFLATSPRPRRAFRRPG
jgi:hypothetical protein